MVFSTYINKIFYKRTASINHFKQTWQLPAFCLVEQDKQAMKSKQRIQLNGPSHAKTCLQAYANREGPDQAAHAQPDPGLRSPLT